MSRTGKSIFKRKDGRYEGRYIVSRKEDGKPKYASVYGKSEHEVEAKLLEIKAKLKAEAAPDVVSFSDAVEHWLEDRRKTLTEATTDRYKYLLDKYFIPEFASRDVSTITELEINTYIAGLANKDERGKNAIGGTTIENLKSTVGSVLSFAKKTDDSYPTLKSLVKIDKESYQPLSSEEIRRLISCTYDNRSIEKLGVLLTLFTGIGTGELCALSWDDFDLTRREIHIAHTIYRVKNKEGGSNRTKLSVTNVRKTAMRTVRYPNDLDSYVREFYESGTVFLTGEKDKYLEQRTLGNRLENAFKYYDLSGLTLQSVKKTYDAGLADTRYLSDPFFMNPTGTKTQLEVQLDERWLIKEMENDLLSLRKLLGVTSYEMSSVIGITEDDYIAIEAGELAMGWDMFLSLLFFFKYNSKTDGVVEALGLYPRALKERMGIYAGT